MSHPNPSAPEDDLGVETHKEPRRFADLGEGSIHVFILICCVLLITPIGNLTPLSVVLGLTIFALGAQLVLRFPHVVMPDLFRDGLEGLTATQKALDLIDRKTPQLAWLHRNNVHWLMLAPFDIFPRSILAICGLVIMIAAPVPSMTHVLGVAGVLMSMAIMSRNLGVFFFGAALMSWSSVLPLVTG